MRGVEYKTLSEVDPAALDRQVTDYLNRDVTRDGWQCAWELYGPQTVTVYSGTFASYKFTQVLVLNTVHWVGEKAELTTVSPFEQKDPILSFVTG